MSQPKAEANIVHREFTADYTGEIHYAQDAAGRVFTRTRARGWGGRYQNSAWRRVGIPTIPNAARSTGRKCRLPRPIAGAVPAADL